MGKEWDDDKGGRGEWIFWLTQVMKECNRVLKPGAHALVWAIPRTSHWTITAVENAGFEIRDVITHLFGSGFPKSLNVQKAGAGDAWQGFGTALKPAAEFWILARKPLSEKTVAKNVLKWGTGALNIDASRIKLNGEKNPSIARYESTPQKGNNGWQHSNRGVNFNPEQADLGRFPANLVFSCSEHCTEDQHDIECAIKRLDDQSVATNGASRFFYCAKVSSSERNAGLDGMPKVKSGIGDERPSGQSMQRLDGRPEREMQNHHPTVKPIKLMSYLITLITPPKGTVLDPFMGSGSTGIATQKSGFKFVGIEKEKDYFDIADKRINNEGLTING